MFGHNEQHEFQQNPMVNSGALKRLAVPTPPVVILLLITQVINHVRRQWLACDYDRRNISVVISDKDTIVGL